MSNANDFVIENGLLKEYTGPFGEIVIPDEVTMLFGQPFMGHTEPTVITLSNNMTDPIVLCEGLTTLNLPAGMALSPTANLEFYGSFFASLAQINVHPDNQSCSSEDGVLYNKEKTVLLSCPPAKTGSVVIPASVTTIAPRAFEGCKLLTQVVLPEGLVDIGERAFADCKAVKKFTIPASVKQIGKEAFLRCAKMRSAGLKGSGKFDFEFPWTDAIPDNAFSGMRQLKKVVLPETIKIIGKGAFKDCKALEEINLPADVKCDKKAFKDCTKLSL